MKLILSFLLSITVICGCTTLEERFPKGSQVTVSEWEMLESSTGEQSLRGIVSNNSPYIVFNLSLITTFSEEGAIKEELRTSLTSLFPNSQTIFEVFLPATLKGITPEFKYEFEYAREQEFWEYRYDKKFGRGPFSFQPYFRSSFYRHDHRKYLDT